MYKILYHPDAVEDVKNFNLTLLSRIEKAIELKLTKHPEYYGLPLKRDLKGYWKLRAGDYRIVFRIMGKEILILGIMHRKKMYQRILPRIAKYV